MQMKYNLPDAFAKAFQNIHGVSSAQARKNNVILRAFLPMTFHYDYFLYEIILSINKGSLKAAFFL